MGEKVTAEGTQRGTHVSKVSPHGAVVAVGRPRPPRLVVPQAGGSSRLGLSTDAGSEKGGRDCYGIILFITKKKRNNCGGVTVYLCPPALIPMVFTGTRCAGLPM